MLKLKQTAVALLLPCLLSVSFAATLNYTIWRMNPTSAADGKHAPKAIALRLNDNLDQPGFPRIESWEKASAVHFDHDWKGEHPSPARSTEVRVLWTPETLFLRFFCRYESLTVYSDARTDGWRDRLWNRDVAEAFLQPDFSDAWKYKELEIAPNGFWIDLDISHGGNQELRSALKRRVVLNEKEKTWTAEIAIPMKALTPAFDPKCEWRVNFYRVEGRTEPRFYSAWSPTNTEMPNFHVPSAFGILAFK